MIEYKKRCERQEKMEQEQNDFSLITGVHHISMETDNWEKSLQFYENLLGLKPAGKGSAEKRRLQLLDAGGNVCVELTELTQKRTGDDVEKAARWAHLAFRVSDTAALMKKVKAAGYEVTMDTTTIHSGDLNAVIGFFKGPQDELIESFQVIDSNAEGTHSHAAG
jgi:catechol 2,3-dioxygenase-like lactoylglutathione lyase family enzyme